MKNKAVIWISIVIVSIAFLGSCFPKEKDKPINSKWLDLALKTEHYIESGKYISDEGETWRVMPDSLNSKVDNALYSGTPGIILFYLELYHATNDSTYLDKSKLGADYLIKTLKDSIYDTQKVGLYTGLAGLGFSLAEVYKTTQELKYKEAALKTVDLIERSSSNTINGIHWGHIPDIVYGGSGIGLYLHTIADEFKYKKADSLAVLIANGILDQVLISDEGMRWKFSPNYEPFLDNFSHGTSGVSYFLAQAYQRTKNETYLDAAIKGANFLSSIETDKGYVPHHLPGGEDLFYLSWCHGPSGTSRLYYVLYDITKDEKWLEKIIVPSDNMIADKIDTQETPGFWNNVGKCCGATSIAEYYIWLYDITGDKKYLDFSNKMTDLVLKKATQDKNTIKWIHAENRTSPLEKAAQTGLMQGSAGMGLWFLELNARKLNNEPKIIIPDKPKVKVRSID